MNDGRRAAFQYRGRFGRPGVSEHATDDVERGGDIGDADVDIAADDDVSAVCDAHLSSFIAQLTEAGGTQRSVERVGELLSAVHGKNIPRYVDGELHALLSENQGDCLARRRVVGLAGER